MRRFNQFIALVILSSCAFLAIAATPAGNDDITVEFYLHRDQKAARETVKQEFATLGVTKVRPLLFPAPAVPPTNIGIGREVPADVARLAIKLALAHNGGITLLLPEERVGRRYIAAGTMMFDLIVQVPVTPADVERLLDPGLSTDQFHELYRRLTGEKPLP